MPKSTNAHVMSSNCPYTLRPTRTVASPTASQRFYASRHPNPGPKDAREIGYQPPSHTATSSVQIEISTGLPTPPPSPDLFEFALPRHPLAADLFHLLPPQTHDLQGKRLGDLHADRGLRIHLPLVDYEGESDDEVAPRVEKQHDRQLPSPLLRVVRSVSSLGDLSGSRTKSNTIQSLWGIMPIITPPTMPTAEPSAGPSKTRRDPDEDSVEALVGGRPSSERKPPGIHWGVTPHKTREHISSIFVHPPTPERDDASMLSTTDHSSQRVSSPRTSPLASPTIPTYQVSSSIISPTPSHQGLARSVPVPLQVLPEVRSPPRRTIAMAADSLQINQKRGRRPRLFGFTELGDSSGSSACSSRQTSPERSASPLSSPNPQVEHITSPLAAPPATTSQSYSGPGPASSPNAIPRRHPVRARSETDLNTLNTIKSNASSPIVAHIPPRKRENGLKLDFTGIIPVASAREQSSIVPSPYSAKLIRKKSGEILKPALKYAGPLGPCGTPLYAPGPESSRSSVASSRSSSPKGARFESKSCPTTPSCPKYVHFDSQLERVKLFLQDQKPQVVSRGGSPTGAGSQDGFVSNGDYTTSEGEEYPFPSSTDDEKDFYGRSQPKKVLQLKLPNFPTSHAPDTDLYLESLFLDDDRKSLRGMIMCRNMAFQKWVAVRFTLDWWQTTSEVTATFKDSVRGGQYDRFAFVVKLHDILGKIEEKTMFMAIRYNTDGKEIWDSNGGQNYQVLFEKTAPPVKSKSTTEPKRGDKNSVSIQPGMGKAVGGRTSQWSVTGGNAEDRLADLRAKLSRLTAEDDRPPLLSPNRDPRRLNFGFGKNDDDVSPGGSPRRSYTTLGTSSSDLPSAGPGLAARYDFGTALKTTRKLSPSKRTIDLPENMGGPVQTGLLNFNSAPTVPSRVFNDHAASEFYSPRFSPQIGTEKLGSDHLFSPASQSLPEDRERTPLTVPDVMIHNPSPPIEDITPTPTPTTARPSVALQAQSPKRPALTRMAASSPAVVQLEKLPSDDGSFSPVSPSLTMDTPEGSMSSTLTDTSPADSPKSPTGIDESGPIVTAQWSPTGGRSDGKDSLASYSSFIEQFCWGGAPSSPFYESRRAHSTSSLDAYFADAKSQTTHFTPSHRPGSTTPRPSSFSIPSQNPPGTPGTPGSTSSYYTSYSSTPTIRDEVRQAEDGRSSLSNSPSPRFVTIGLGRMSPPVAC